MAKRKRVSLSENPLTGNGKKLEAQDPISTTPMVVKIRDVEPFDRNPRRHANQHFEDIKESIRIKGLEQPFTITRRPGEEHYIIKAGGNTRLEALKQLHDETGDERFATAQVIFEPFVSEADMLISHLTENDVRGNLLLIDRAQGIRDAKASIEEEQGTELSNRELAEALKDQGYKVRRQVIDILDYALDELYPYMPIALDNGMGRPQVERIRKFQSQMQWAWEMADNIVGIPVDSEKRDEIWLEVFRASLEKADAENFNLNHLLDVFENLTADRFEWDINRTRFYTDRAMRVPKLPTKEEREFHASRAMEAIRLGLDPDELDDEVIYDPDVDLAEIAAQASEPVEPPVMPQSDPVAATPDSTEPESEEPVVTEPEAGPSEASAEPAPVSSSSDSPAEPVEPDDTGEGEFEASYGQDDEPGEYPITKVTFADPAARGLTISDLRHNALSLAISIAQAAHIEDLVMKLDDGFGWMLTNTPQSIHFPNGLDESCERFQEIWRYWYLLFSLSGATVESCKATLSAHIPEENNDLKHLMNNEFHRLSEIGVYVSTMSVRHDFWMTVDHEVFDKAQALMVTQRQINDLAEKLDVNAWKGA